MPRRPYGRRHKLIRLQVMAEEDLCRICGNPVDKTLPGTHPDGPTAHHLKPRARGGLDTRENYGLAHSRCNKSFGDGTQGRYRRRRIRTSRQW